MAILINLVKLLIFEQVHSRFSNAYTHDFLRRLSHTLTTRLSSTRHNPSVEKANCMCERPLVFTLVIIAITIGSLCLKKVAFWGASGQNPQKNGVFVEKASDITSVGYRHPFVSYRYPFVSYRHPFVSYRHPFSDKTTSREKETL